MKKTTETKNIGESQIEALFEKPMVFITSDHSGVVLKKQIFEHLKKRGFEVQLLGSNTGTAPDDYPDFANEIASKILSVKNSKGIAICGTGIGISIAANKFDGIYCGLCTSPEIAFFARTHNDCNCLALGSRYISKDNALKIVDTFLQTPFEGGRHIRRIQKIKDTENNAK